MKIVSLVENTSRSGLSAVHGLSVYIETEKHKILFDLGPDGTFIKNADALGIDLSAVDTVVISHGHADHGGGLRFFTEINESAKIYVQKRAFEKHYSMSGEKHDISLEECFLTHPQIILTNGDHEIDETLSLITTSGKEKYRSEANDVLFDSEGIDTFPHEQSLLIKDKETVLILGCGHRGVVNIMEKAASYRPSVIIGGFHLFNPRTGKVCGTDVLDGIAGELAKRPETRFLTCHCTGEKAYIYLKTKMDLSYFSAGDILEL